MKKNNNKKVISKGFSLIGTYICTNQLGNNKNTKTTRGITHIRGGGTKGKGGGGGGGIAA
jgi:hypothetical protein